MRKSGRAGRFFVFGALFSSCVSLFFLMSQARAQSAYPEEPFPLLPGLEARVNFWKVIFSEVSSWQTVLHDVDRFVIYDVIDFRELFGGRQVGESVKAKEIERVQSSYQDLLRLLARQELDPLSLSSKGYELYVKSHGLGEEVLLRAADNIRAQAGLRDKFLEGLIISGRYDEEMRAIFRKYDLPEDLVVLPHIESNFNYRAYSKKGAAGMWQFMPATGRMFMRIDRTVDERLDPLASTEAAAQFLRQNYGALGNWPLAITAYNHGRQGMRNAMAETGSTNLVDIIETYRGRFFGFASKNFYAEFLAALEVVKNYQDHFGEVEWMPSFEYESHKLSRPVRVGTLLHRLKLSQRVLQEYNPALRLAALGSRGHIPAGFVVKVPRERGENLPSLVALASATEEDRSDRREALWYKVKKGDTLGTIARRHKTSVKTLKTMNGIRHAHRIRVGQLLKLPARTFQAIGKALGPSEVEAAVEESGTREKAKHLPKRSSQPSKGSSKPPTKQSSKRSVK